MTEEEIVEKYHLSISQSLEQARSFADNKYFDKMFEFCSTDYGYNIFYPVASNCFNVGLEFAPFCDFFKNLDWACQEHDIMLFAHVVTEYEFNRTPMSERFNLPRTLEFTNTFVDRGDWNFYSKDRILETAIKHFHDVPHTLKEIHTTFMSYEVIDFLHSLLPDIKDINEKLKLDDNGAAYRKADKALEQKMINFIKSSKYYYVQKF